MFVNFDPSCRPFEEHVGDLDAHFERWPLERRFKQAHVAKILRCNWKVAQEAFMEAFHVVATHPQLLAGIGDANSQYDVFGSFSRAITPNGTPSPHLSWAPTEQEMFDAMTDRRLDEPPAFELAGRDDGPPSGGGGRPDVAAPVIGSRGGRGAVRRGAHRQLLLTRCSRTSIRGVRTTASSTGSGRTATTTTNRSWSACSCRPTRRRAAARRLRSTGWAPTTSWTDAPELGFLARVFNQDAFNLPSVQRGLKAAVKPGVTLSLYQETKIRHFHRMLEEQLGL